MKQSICHRGKKNQKAESFPWCNKGSLVRIAREDTTVMVIIKVTNSQVHWRMLTF